MCGRFTQRFSWQQVHDYMNLIGEPVELRPRYNVAPGQDVAAVRAFEDGRRLSMLRWGLLRACPGIGDHLGRNASDSRYNIQRSRKSAGVSTPSGALIAEAE